MLAGVQYFDTHLWQAVVLGYIGAPFIGAYIIVMAPLLLQLLPRAGGLGERLGVLLAPFNLCSVLLAYIAAIVIDATGNYRLIWLFPAATGLAHATVNCWLKYPDRRATTPDMVGRLWEWSVVQAESMAEMGLVTGLLAAPVLGVVTKEDADSAVVIDMARNILGNPYEPDRTGRGPTGTGRGGVGQSVALGRRIGPLGHRRPPGRWGPGGRPGERGPEVRVGWLLRWSKAKRRNPASRTDRPPSGQAEAVSEVEAAPRSAQPDRTPPPYPAEAWPRPAPWTRSTPTGDESKKPEPPNHLLKARHSPGAATGTEEE